jgi:hypothetical protein
MKPRDLIVTVLLNPRESLGLSGMEWDLLIRQGRRANLLARLAHQMAGDGLLDAVPQRPRLHLISALRMVERQNKAMRREVRCIGTALSDIAAETGIILLKGAAYVMADLPVASGRSFSDIDILVPKSHLARTESQLMLNGWQGTHHDDYDQRYYRRWMHEIPPMRHVRRETHLDVHHAILPETARLKVDTPALFQNRIALPGHPGLFILAPIDMLLHSATHLFHEGSLDNGLRDLFDLDGLFRHFGKNPDFWAGLVPRALALGLERPLYYAVRFCGELLDTPMPSSSVIAAARAGKPAPMASWLADYCYRRALRPPHASCDSAGTPWARGALYVRSHWLRMPIPLLAYHLLHKALRRSVPASWGVPLAGDGR